jgi:hypothetical protein
VRMAGGSWAAGLACGFFFPFLSFGGGGSEGGEGQPSLGSGKPLTERDGPQLFFLPQTVAKTGKFGFLSVGFPVAGKNESGRGYLRVDVQRGVGAV